MATYAVDWEITGSCTIKAKSRDEAQKKFDELWESTWHQIVQNGEMVFSEPELEGR